MGVPKFYRWFSERYPCLSEVVKEYQIPEFDNLYLDMNGIIHVCSHPEDDNPHFRITEEKIFNDIFHYIEKSQTRNLNSEIGSLITYLTIQNHFISVLFRMIRPKKVFYMAIDGVAPRAKMNQQRGRRFRSAMEAEDLVRQALAKGEILPTQQRFDSNCITPGTEFMAKLHEQLKYFVVQKISTDRMWQGVRVILSGHETPGEGEHKVMDFIRYEKAMPDHDPNTRHCLYGLDADLVMLGLISHEPHFSLLREEVRFGGKKSKQRSVAPEETVFHLLHLQLMREYLDFEFGDLKNKLPFEYDLENIIDDWVLLGYLVGNDFIPHLPNMHIHGECLPLLWNTYKRVLPTLGGYMNNAGKLDLPRFEKFLTELAQNDIQHFTEQFSDLKYMESKRGKKRGGAGEKAWKPRLNAALDSKATGIPTANEFMNLQDESMGDDDMGFLKPRVISNEALEAFDFTEEGMEKLIDEDDPIRLEFKRHKANYYMDKMDFTEVTEEVLRDLARGYVLAIQWILSYYYDGVPSWSWFYPRHYAPFLSDVRGFSNMDITFEYSKPFLPFQQLMAVLPSASKNLLPLPLQGLMIGDSPVVDFYPEKFATDLNGKLQEWEAVVLIPFIDEKRLLSAMQLCEDKLTDEEKARNKHGPHMMAEYSVNKLDTYISSLPGDFPDIEHNHAKCTELGMWHFRTDPAILKRGLCEGVRLDVFFPGFPTLKHLSHTARLQKEGVKVFQMNSRGDNMILQLVDTAEPDVEQVAKEYIGRSVYVSWPHMFEARVLSVSTPDVRYCISESSRTKTVRSEGEVDIKRTEMTSDERDIWHRDVESITSHYRARKGIDVGPTFILLRATPMTGRKYVFGHQGSITIEKQWSSLPVPFVYQASVKDIAVKDASFKQYKTLDELFPAGSEVFMLGSPHYGSMGQVLNVESSNDGRVRVDFITRQEPRLEQARNAAFNLTDSYKPARMVANRVGISSYIVSRMTGTIYVNHGSREDGRKDRTQVGMNLKFNKTSMEVPGWSRKEEDGTWMYSHKVVEALEQYLKRFPDLFNYISQTSNDDQYYEDEIFEESGEQSLKAVKDFLAKLGCSSVPPMKHGSDILDDIVIAEIEKEADMVKEQNRKRKKHVKMQVRPHLLYRSMDCHGISIPDPSAKYLLFDRVTNVRESYTVPVGLRGTVVGILGGEKEQDILYEVVFDGPFIGGLTIRCSPLRGYRMPATALINLTHGLRKEHKSMPKPTGVDKAQVTQYDAMGHEITTNLSTNNNRGQGPDTNSNWRKPAPDYRQPEGYTDAYRRQGGYNQGPYRDGAKQHGYQNVRSQGSQERDPSGLRIQENKGDFADLWSSLKGNPPGNRTKSTGANRNNNQHQGQSGRSEHYSHEQPSLEKAAMAWQHSLFPEPQQPDAKRKERSEFFSQQYSIDTNKNTAENRNQEAPAGNMQKIVLDDLFGSAKPEKAAADPSSTGEFSQIFESLQISDKVEDSSKPIVEDSTESYSEQQTKEGTQALCEILNLGGSRESSNELASQEAEAPQKKGQPSYGMQLSVEELFQGAAQHSVHTEQKQHAAKKPQPPQPPQQPQQLQQPHLATQYRLPQQQQQLFQQTYTRQPQYVAQRQQQTAFTQQQQFFPAARHQQQLPPQQLYQQPQRAVQQPSQVHQMQNRPRHQHRSAVVDLHRWCQSLKLPPPKFDCQPGRDGKMCAIVSLANNLVFKGSYTRHKEQAMESAAGVALINMSMSPFGFVGNTQGVFSTFPPSNAPFSASPNSAFTPVRSDSGPQGPLPFGKAPANQPFPNPPVRQNIPPPQPFLHTRQLPHGAAPGLYYQGQPYLKRHPGSSQAEFADTRAPPRGNEYVDQRNHRYQTVHGNETERDLRQPVDESRSGPDQQKKEMGSDSTTKTPVKNPFIPLQVQRQQKTPQRDIKTEAGHQQTQNASEPSVTTIKSLPNQNASDRETLPHQKQQSADQNTNRKAASVTVKMVPSTDNTKPSLSNNISPSAGKTTKLETASVPSRRPKSRIAARFGKQ